MIAPSRDHPWVLTASGVAFDLDAPRPEDVRPEDLAHALSHLCRFNGHVRTFYSVAQHCVLVSTLVPAEHALAGLLHDAGEAYTGDLVTPIKRGLLGYVEIERRIDRVIERRFSLEPQALDARAVREADRVALLAERDALLAPSPRPWAEDGGPAPSSTIAIDPWPPTLARARFLKRLHDLTSRGPRP